MMGGCGQDSSGGDSPYIQDADEPDVVDEESNSCTDECVNGSCADGACLCATGYAGPTCDVCAPEYQDLENDGRCSPRCSVAELDCGDNEVCDDRDGTAVCVCDVGYTGPDCSSCVEGFVDEGQGCRAEPMTVWDATTDPAPIYVPDDAPPLVLEAANDLADYLARASGKARPPVIEQAATAEVPQRAIKVGYPNNLTERDEIQIEILPGGPLSLTGVDVFDPENPDWVDQETEYNFMNQAGTHNAVMTFLHDYLGVVWGWPGKLGEAVPSRAELKIDPINKTHTPSAMIRNCMGFSEAGNRSGYGISKELQKRNRNLFSLHVHRGHEMNKIYDDFHPDVNDDKTEDWMFALQPDGTRGGFPYGRVAKVEVGDPAFDDLFMSWIVEASLAENPLKESFSCSMNDGSQSGHSRDPRALAMDYDGPDAVYFNFRYEDRTIRAPTITDELDAMNGPGPHYIVTREDLPDGNLASGTATSGDSNTLRDTSKSFTADQHAGRALRITGGTNSGEVRFIVSNTEDTITVRSDFSEVLDGTTEYEITAMYLVSVDLKHSGRRGAMVRDIEWISQQGLESRPRGHGMENGEFQGLWR